MRVPAKLLHLPRAGSLPVPWINVRGEETDEWGWQARPDHRALGGQLGWFANSPGGIGATSEGADFTKQCPQRQRDAMVNGLCQVCGERITSRRRLVVLMTASVQVVDVTLSSGRAVRAPSVTEPWMHPDCAGYSLRACPHLRRRDLVPVWTTRWQLLSAVASHDANPGVEAISWVKLILHDAERANV